MSSELIAIALVVFAISILILFISVIRLGVKLRELAKKFEEHGHGTSLRGGTIHRPVHQKEVSFEQLLSAIQGIQNQGIPDVKAVGGFLDAATGS